MNFVALLLGLAIERVLTQLFHLREFRWLDPVIDAHLRRFRNAGRPLAMAATAGLAILLSAPVALVSVVLWDELLQIPYFAFAVVVLLFSLGPRDLDQEVDDYCGALERGDTEAQRRIAKELLEHTPPDPSPGRNLAVERAIYVQANNRIFGVVFWFVLLGPSGAWLFRVLDLIRRRSEYEMQRPEEARPGVDLGAAARSLHGVLAWPASRLLALGYVLAGNFEEAVTSWRNGGSVSGLSLAEGTDEIVSRVGMAASGRAALDIADSTDALDRIRAARGLVMRTLWMIWCPGIAILTLYEWLA